jgi:hypothetical protein
LIVAVSDTETDELEKLLADVLRTIRDNDQFIRQMKEESCSSDGADTEEKPATDGGTDDGGYEEL